MGPLQWLKDNSPSEGRARQIFLLTDGEVSNVTEVLDLCRSMASSTRIFSFGLGQSPSRSLVKGLARTTNGRFVFIPPNAQVDIYVGEQLQKALHPCLTNVHVQWNVGVAVQSAPRECPPVYVNDRLIVYALLNNDEKSNAFDHDSSVELCSGDRSLGLAKIDRIPAVAENQTIARLAAKALILELQHQKTSSAQRGSTQARFQGLNNPDEDKEETISDRQRILNLSLKYQILSPHTAFVGIEKRMNASNDQMVLREVPIEVSSDDQHLIRSAQVRSPFAPMFHGRRLKAARNMFGFQGGRGGGGFHMLASNTAPNCVLKSMSMEFKRTSMNSMAKKRRCVARRAPSSDEDNEEDIGEPILRRESSSKRNVQPPTDEDTVRSLIDKQRFDGLWDADATIIQQLTGKSLASWQSTNADIDATLLNSLIIILVLEERFATHSSLWYGIVQKARTTISNLLVKDAKNIDTYLAQIRAQL